MSFSSFCQNRRGVDLRQRLFEEREFSLLGAPRCDRLYGNDTFCAIRRPLCDRYDPFLANYGDPFIDRTYGRGSGGWQRIGYLLPLYVEAPLRRSCNCSRRRHHNSTSSPSGQTWSKRQFPLVRQPSQFSSEQHAPYDCFDNDHDPECALFANPDNCQNRQCGVRRYNLYVRVDPERLGQQCFRTSCHRNDNRYNNCRYLQFGVAEEGHHDSTIMLINSDYLVDSPSNRLTRAARCIENGDVLFVPGERNRKFRVHLYDEQIYDGNCY